MMNTNVSRRTFLKTVAGAAGASTLAAEPGDQAAAFGRVLGLDRVAGNKRPNILYIHSHDTGRFTSPYGHAVPTPNLHRLALDGVTFSRAFCAAPTCSPSRASLLTGQSPHNNGMLGLAHRGFSLNDYSQHIVHTLRREAGYRSTLIGLQHIARNPTVIGYDQVEVIPHDHVEQVAPAAARFLRSRPARPFWLTVGFFETHRVYRRAGPEDDARHTLPPPAVPDVPATRRDMADFHATVRKLDGGVGEVLAALEDTGLAENTLVISTTDHGIAFPKMKCCLYDGGMGVHLVMRGPGGFSGGKLCNALVSQIDLFPTLCDLLEIRRPDWLQGRSFLPIIRGERAEINEAVFSEVNYHAAYEPKRAVRTGRWKYIRHFGDYPHPVLPNCDPGPSKKYWMENGWERQPMPAEELYDLMFDPNERNNLMADPVHRRVCDDMRARLHRWMEETSDPLLRGPVPAPPGARIDPAYPDATGNPPAAAPA